MKATLTRRRAGEFDGALAMIPKTRPARGDLKPAITQQVGASGTEHLHVIHQAFATAQHQDLKPILRTAATD